MKLFLLALLTAFLALTGCSNSTSAVSEDNLKHLLLLELTYTSQHSWTFSKMATPDAAKADLLPILTHDQATQPQNHWSEAVFIDPASGQPFQPNPSLTGSSYLNIPTALIIAFYAPEPVSGKRLVGFCDGHMGWVDESKWPNIQTASFSVKPDQ